MTKPTIFDLPSEETKHDESGAPRIVDPGDAVLVLKLNGRVRPITVGMDAREIAEAVHQNRATPEQEAMLANSRKLFALLIAASSPQIMEILYDIAENPDVIDLEKMAALSSVMVH